MGNSDTLAYRVNSKGELQGSFVLSHPHLRRGNPPTVPTQQIHHRLGSLVPMGQGVLYLPAPLRQATRGNAWPNWSSVLAMPLPKGNPPHDTLDLQDIAHFFTPQLPPCQPIWPGSHGSNCQHLRKVGFHTRP
jgi:hypothetical protein